MLRPRPPTEEKGAPSVLLTISLEKAGPDEATVGGKPLAKLDFQDDCGHYNVTPSCK